MDPDPGGSSIIYANDEETNRVKDVSTEAKPHMCLIL